MGKNVAHVAGVVCVREREGREERGSRIAVRTGRGCTSNNSRLLARPLSGLELSGVLSNLLANL
jgi:hypothetical protein